MRLKDEICARENETKKQLELIYNEENHSVETIPAQHKSFTSHGIIVKDIDNCLVRLAHCCNPIAGDDIVGFITKGRGVSVHRSDCPNMRKENMSEEDLGRFIDVSWDSERSTSYTATLQIESKNRDGVLLEITNILANLKIPFKSVNAYINKQDVAIINLGVEIRNTTDLALLVKKIRQLQGVINITRNSN